MSFNRRRKQKTEEETTVSNTRNASKVMLTDNGQIVKITKENKGNLSGIKFDSKMEAEYYLVLLEKQKKGLIEEIRLQPRFTLQDGFMYQGKKVLEIAYVADFEVIYPDGRAEYIDVKGHEDAQFKIKHKMFKFRYPDHTLILMKKVMKFGGWITVEEYDQKKAAENKAKKAAEKLAQNF